MTILQYLEKYKLVTITQDATGAETGILTKRAEYLGYTDIEDLITDIEDIFLVDFKTKSIIPAYRYLDNPVAVIGDSISDVIKFRVYNNLKYSGNVDLTDANIIPEITWQNNTNNLQGIFQVFVSDDEKNGKIVEGNVITFDWTIDPRALYQSGDLEFGVRFISYYYNENNINDPLNNTINYNLATQSIKLNIETSLNFISTLGEDNFSITLSFANPYLNNQNTYIIDGGNMNNNF